MEKERRKEKKKEEKLINEWNSTAWDPLIGMVGSRIIEPILIDPSYKVTFIETKEILIGELGPRGLAICTRTSASIWTLVLSIGFNL